MKEIIKKWNPWWVYGKVPPEKKGIVRKDILGRVFRLIKTKESIIISGVRRCGKSTLMYQIIDMLINHGIKPDNILYFNFDEPFESRNAEKIEEVFRTYAEELNPKDRKYIFFDEIQSIPQWELWIKKHYDLYGEDIKFILTGSNSSMLSDRLGKLLSGRMFLIRLYPLSFNEFLQFKNFELKDIELQKAEIQHYFSKYIETGGFPEVVLEKDSDINRQRLKGYFDSIILRDIVTSKNIRETAKLNELAYYSMTIIGSMMSYNKIAKAIGLNINSVKEYLHYLENAYLIFQLNIFSYSLKETIMMQQPRKIYAIDTGLRNAASFKFSSDAGKLVENIVFLELKKRFEELYYWKNKHEVDFVAKNKGELMAINVTYDKEIKEREVESLLEFKKKFKNVKELIILTKNVRKTDKKIKYIPINEWLLADNA